jgi:1-acyl-sn-glycerol-3-phosphate acyltransferase
VQNRELDGRGVHLLVTLQQTRRTTLMDMREMTPRGPMIQRAARALLRRPFRRLWPTTLTGLDRVPREDPAVLCANHLSFFDSVVMMMTIDRPVYFIGKAEYLDSWKTRRLLPAMGMIPIDRDNGTRAMAALDAAADVLRDGALLCVFPEGTRSRDGDLHRGYIGAARVAMSVGCPILPVGIVGTREIQPPGARLPRPGRACSVSIGAPLAAKDVEVSSRRSAARALTNQVMDSIAELSGQRYVDVHGSRSPASEPSDRRPRARAGDFDRRVPVPA